MREFFLTCITLLSPTFGTVDFCTRQLTPDDVVKNISYSCVKPKKLADLLKIKECEVIK